ncbi:lipopolysaccharide 1,3-galactosyltransferase [Citrobacter sp. NCU1]|uniref:glycosyltransferase family 8 protein n=1 Tax=Citrobacter sp. NCU1 TaxID=2026683 RepID=UPI0013917E25|nr:glycosyltransferase family 8 protein [Citrobacter sp. NCU1]NDO82369.1 lipopolysaccharide 1,3-galactosyltransferase [Citrobacter sp. NCU1]
MINVSDFVAKKEELFPNIGGLANTLHISLCFDCGFVMPAGVAIFSIIENNKNINLHFHLLVSDVSANDMALFHELNRPNVSITIYHIKGSFNINPETLVLGIPLSTCLRFLIPEVIDQSITNVMYLDCDIICYSNLIELVNYDLQNNIAGVISDSIEMQARVDNLDYGVNFIKYFNAGVMLINTQEWRENNITQKALTMINSGKIYRYADQDVLNILLNGRLQYLNAKFNNKTTLSVYHNAENENIKNTVIMHYVTPNKPWYLIFNANNFGRYFSQSPWRNAKRYLSPSASEIRIKSKLLWKGSKYGEAISYYLRYLLMKIFNMKF